jgi:O-antigen/teichoic acid export membrane protein
MPRPSQRPPAVRSPIAIGSIANLTASIVVFGSALLTGVLVARELGPAGKGVVSTVSFVMVILSVVSGVGLGEAAVALVGSGRWRADIALRSSLALLSLTGVVGALTMAAVLQSRLLTTEPMPLWVAAVVAAGVPLTAAVVFLARFSEARHRLVRSAASRVTGPVTALGLTAALLFGAGLGRDGALLALSLALFVPFVVLLVSIPREERGLPTLDKDYLRAALGVGRPLAGAALLLVAAGRLDILVVLLLLDQAAAGQYSIALTIVELVLMATGALMLASSPTLAALERIALPAFTAQLVRMSLLMTAGAAAVTAIVLPRLVPLVYGEDFVAGVGPALILLVGTLPLAVQHVLTGALAARGSGSFVLASYAAALGSMLALDILLIPAFGLLGAATASVVGAVVGAVVAIVSSRREGMLLSFISALRPSVEDLRTARATVLRLLSVANTETASSPSGEDRDA